MVEFPEWYDGKNVNEVKFCEEFLKIHPMKSVNGTFFTVEGRVTDEDGKERTCFLVYSLGNLISGQNRAYTDLTAAVNIELTKDPYTGETEITAAEYTPMIMIDLYDYGIADAPWRCRLWDLEEAIAGYEAGDDRGVITPGMYTRLLTSLDDCGRIFGPLEFPAEETAQ